MFTQLFWFLKWNSAALNRVNSTPVCAGQLLHVSCTSTDYLHKSGQSSLYEVTVQQNSLKRFPCCYYNHQSQMGYTWWCKMWSCPVQQWEGESVNLWKINIVLYLQYVVSNLYIPANRLRIIQKVPTPTSFDLSTTADMLLRSSYIKKGYSENKILDYCLHCSFHIAQINNPLISSWSSEHVTFHCWNGANHSVNLAKHIIYVFVFWF